MHSHVHTQTVHHALTRRMIPLSSAHVPVPLHCVHACTPAVMAGEADTQCAPPIDRWQRGRRRRTCFARRAGEPQHTQQHTQHTDARHAHAPRALLCCAHSQPPARVWGLAAWPPGRSLPGLTPNARHRRAVATLLRHARAAAHLQLQGQSVRARLQVCLHARGPPQGVPAPPPPPADALVQQRTPTARSTQPCAHMGTCSPHTRSPGRLCQPKC